MKLEELQEIADQFNALNDDKSRFQFVIENKALIGLTLDNDGTWPHFTDTAIGDLILADYDDLPRMNSFHDYLGWSQGVRDLLNVIGVDAEPC